MIARMAAAIDEISGGRFVLGLGCGWNEPEFTAFGIPYDHRVARFEEAFAIIRGLVAGEHVTLAGRYWQAADAVAAAAAGAAHAARDRLERPAHARHRPAPRRRLEHLVGRLRQHRRGLRRR